MFRVSVLIKQQRGQAAATKATEVWRICLAVGLHPDGCRCAVDKAHYQQALRDATDYRAENSGAPEAPDPFKAFRKPRHTDFMCAAVDRNCKKHESCSCSCHAGR